MDGRQLIEVMQRLILGRPISGVISNIPITAVSGRSDLLTLGKMYHVIPTVNSWVKVDTNNPTAVLGACTYLPEGHVFKFVADVADLKIAVIRASSALADGILSISEMAKVPVLP